MAVPVGPPGAEGPQGAVAGGSGRRRRILWVALGVAVVVAGLVGVLAARGPVAAAPGPCALCGKPAPPISGSSLDQAASPVGLGGRFVVVSFFASWCGPCREEEPQLEAFAREHQPSRDATVLGVVFDDAAINVGDYLSSTGATWPAVGDPGGRIALEYGVGNPAETYLVAPNGLVVAKFFGPVRAAQLDGAMSRARSEGA